MSARTPNDETICCQCYCVTFHGCSVTCREEEEKKVVILQRGKKEKHRPLISLPGRRALDARGKGKEKRQVLVLTLKIAERESHHQASGELKGRNFKRPTLAKQPLASQRKVKTNKK
ncbi:RNA helicase [Anopheles sinensis]|uniref:RNA helicase n=1 Tax=Anopheles sinensis TaxID=74873 RepID=A0A084WS27_ANOSI|nr:RNA helicase [Anopheles sinensis]